jgi:hypothetical protein
LRLSSPFRWERRLVMVDRSRDRYGGALAQSAPGFTAWLVDAGYAPLGAIKQLHLFTHVTRWLEREDLAPRTSMPRRSVGPSRIGARQFKRGTWACGRRSRCSPSPRGSAVRVVKPDGPVEELPAGYERFGVRERGVLPASARGCAINVRQFLERFARREEMTALCAGQQHRAQRPRRRWLERTRKIFGLGG